MLRFHNSNYKLSLWSPLSTILVNIGLAKQKKLWICPWLLAFFVTSFWVVAQTKLSSEALVTPHLIVQVEKQYGEMAKRRIIAWKKLMDEGKNWDDQKKLSEVNDYFNQYTYKSDLVYVGKADYWMTPVEFITSGGGDCEDFSIAKYFTLQAMNIPTDRLRITYVKALKLKQAHMVLTYFANPGAEPLVLDNLTSEIKSASERSDLEPVYSVNVEGVWLSKQRSLGKRIGGVERISQWKGLLERMEKT